MTTPEPPEGATLEARNGRAAFMRGFGHGATHRAKCSHHTGHPTLAPDYEAGYLTGVHASGRASAAASERYGFTPSILREAGSPTPDPTPVTRITWAEFQKSGMLWAVNRWLHMFGLAIVVATDDDTGEFVDAWPARTSWRGFPPDREELGFERVSEYLRENGHDL